MAEGIGLFTLSLQWKEGGSALQMVTGGDWGPQGQVTLYVALKAAADKAQEAMIEAAVQERLAKKEECPQ